MFIRLSDFRDFPYVLPIGSFKGLPIGSLFVLLAFAPAEGSMGKDLTAILMGRGAQA